MGRGGGLVTRPRALLPGQIDGRGEKSNQNESQNRHAVRLQFVYRGMLWKILRLTNED